MKQKAVFIVGPTATGKTDLGLAFASKFNGDVISADSVQVYRNLDIISGKDLPSVYKYKNGYYYSDGLPSIYLLDVVEPTTSFSVSDFYKKATTAIEGILSNGKLPLVIGGTGLYVEVLLNGLDKTAKPDIKLREQLDKLNILELQKIAPKKDLAMLNDSDRQNPRRLIRVIEKEKSKNKKVKSFNPNYESLVIGLSCEKEILKQRIDNRVDERLKNGAMEEAKSLFENHENLAQPVKDANGYKQLFSFLKNEISMDEAIYRWKISEYRHAKNQMTWFRKYGNVIWFDINEVNFREKIEMEVHKFLL